MRSLCLRLFIIGMIFTLSSCTKIKDLLNPPTPREIYEREFEEDNPHVNAWKAAFEESLNDSLLMYLPYKETGYFYSDEMNVYSYNAELEQGEIFYLEITTDSVDERVFIDFYRQKNDSLNSYDFVDRNEPTDRRFRFEVGKSGTYKVIIQPAIDVQTPFTLMAYTMPSYGFPLAGYDNEAIKSFWGASRDAGKRQHEGIDIFAPRGTPVIAATDGRISYTGERGLGGKQVWLRSGLFGGHSLYYAHLDSIAVDGTWRVSRGDTLGFVGNSGNARTTSPHLHFGIYGSGGAVNPLPFVYKRNRPKVPEPFDEAEKRELVVNSLVANLRTAASMQGEKIGEVRQGDTLQLLGRAENWWQIKTEYEMKAFIHESLVEYPLRSR